MRRTLPRKTDLAAVTNQRFNELVRAYNNTPRKCLGYLTPAEVFWDQVLHLKCESTFLLSLERRGRLLSYFRPAAPKYPVCRSN